MEAGVRELDSKLTTGRNSMKAKMTIKEKEEHDLLVIGETRRDETSMEAFISITWNDHEDSVGHDEHLHGAHSPTRRKNATIGDEVDHELGVEEGAEPESRADVEDDHGVDQPGELHGRIQLVDALALDDGEGRPGRNR